MAIDYLQSAFNQLQVSVSPQSGSPCKTNKQTIKKNYFMVFFKSHAQLTSSVVTLSGDDIEKVSCLNSWAPGWTVSFFLLNIEHLIEKLRIILGFYDQNKLF